MSTNAEIPARALAERLQRSSDDVFPPQTSRAAEIEAFIELLRGVLPNRNALYVSAPITSGRRFVEWRSQGHHLSFSDERYYREHLEHVVIPNRNAVAALVKEARNVTAGFVIDPTAVGQIETWSQGDYRTVWARVIEQFVETVIFADGWEFSNGCSFEFLIATKAGIRTLDKTRRPIDLATGAALVRHAIDELSAKHLSTEFLKGILQDLATLIDGKASDIRLDDNWIRDAIVFKDSVLDALANHGNVAQFVSFSPKLDIRSSRLLGHPPNGRFDSPRSAIQALLASSVEHSVNIRSYHPEHPKSREFVYGLRDMEAAENTLRRLATEGLYTIVNETVDVHDGGVSGVVLGNVIEFAPGDTPRCVEKPGTTSVPRAVGLAMLQRVYGFAPSLPSGRWRLEFSVHPIPRGHRHGHTILWEAETDTSDQQAPHVQWPNHFSRFLGDKVFGLLLADCLGLPVPRTMVVSRNVAPFEFGRTTGTGETWIRTAPQEPAPGMFTTRRGWMDPFKLLAEEDPAGDHLASVISQEGVRPVFSGGVLGGNGQPPVVEGVEGLGQEFMLGQKGPEQLPATVMRAVNGLMDRVLRLLGGKIKLEWVFDGEVAWLVQMQRVEGTVDQAVVVPGNVERFRRFDVAEGIERFREIVREAKESSEGIVLFGAVGVTSHFGDILRRSGIPSRIEYPV